MILNKARTQAICNLGWADNGYLWVYSLEKGTSDTFRLNSSNYLKLIPGCNDFFATISFPSRGQFEVTANHHSNPQKIISRVSAQLIESAPDSTPQIAFEGDRSVWEQLPKAYIVNGYDDFRLLLIRGHGDYDLQKFEWYDDSYDKGYQGIVGVTDIPNSQNLIVSIQRDSNPVLYDPIGERAIRKLTLADRYGNPSFFLRATANEFWVSDYDTIVKLDAKTLDVKGLLLLQEASSSMSRLFIGSFCFDESERRCLVARPFSGDAVLLDADSLHIIGTQKLGKQPLDIALLADGTVIARDWKTGDFLFQKLK